MLRTAPGPSCFRVAATGALALIVLLNKPHGVLCQFTDGAGRPTLAGLVPYPGVYPAGRLDHDSEGLLVLTDDGALAHRLTDPRHRHGKTYLVQVEGEPTASALAALRAGPLLRDGPTRPVAVRELPAAPAWLWPRDPPVRFRKAIPTAWLELTIHEGRNRQVRRMTAAVGLPTLRLVRTAVAGYALGDLAPGAVRVVDAAPAPPSSSAPRGRSDALRPAARARAPAAGRPPRGRR